MTKYIFVTGGVISGVGKGITAASIGAVLKAKGAQVSMQKLDPYFNVDAGLLNPAEHGECFVTRDGAETDLDLGSYERFLDEEMTDDSIATSGKLFAKLLERERAGKFHGKSVQLVPHFTGLIQETIQVSAEHQQALRENSLSKEKVHMVEIGGTVGDLEGAHFIEAIREMPAIVGRENCFFLHVVFVPYLSTSHEFKTKPAQNALRDLREFGIIPNMVAVRLDVPVDKISRNQIDSIAQKIRTFSGVENVVILPNSASVYDIPLTTENSGAIEPISKFVGGAKFAKTKPDMRKWEQLSQKLQKGFAKEVKIGLVAKYVDNTDTYMSVCEALKSAGFANDCRLKIKWINAEKLEQVSESELADILGKLDGIVVPGGFGARGVEGKIRAADYAFRENIPYLGLCLGLQAAVIASARRGGLEHANSEEFVEKLRENVVYIMSGQEGKESTGGTLRLGDYPAQVTGKIREIYGTENVIERHRHRYEVNKKFIQEIGLGGLRIAGTSPDGKLVEFVEAEPKFAKKFYVATQAHPEFRSRPTAAHPLFREFIASALEDK